jgi:hypothetical protein
MYTYHSRRITAEQQALEAETDSSAQIESLRRGEEIGLGGVEGSNSRPVGACNGSVNILYCFDQVFINFGFFDVREDRKFSFRIIAIFAHIKKKLDVTRC